MTPSPVPRPFSRRSLLAGAASAAAVAGLSACAAGTRPSGGQSSEPVSSSSTSGGKVTGGTLSILAYASDLPKEEIQAFEKEHQCKVKVEEYSFDKLTAMLASNRAPDICLGYGGYDTPYLAYKQVAEPLDERLDASTSLKKDDLADINNLWRYDGTKQGEGPLYGLVKDYSNDLTLWVNSNLTGSVPAEGELWTYDQLLDVAKKSTKQSSGRVESYGYEFYEDKPHIMHLEAMMQSDGGASMFNPDHTQIDLTQPAGVKAVDFFRQLIEAKATTSSLSKSSSNTWQLFEAGRLAVLQSGYWTQGMFTDYKDAVKKNLYMIPAPQMGADRVSPVLSGAGQWIPKGAKNKDLAWAWMEYYFGGKPAQDRASSGWGVPALKSLEGDMPDETPLNKRALACQKGETQYFKTLTFTPYARVDACNTLLVKELENGIKANKPTTDICAAISTSINQVLTRGKR